ncbi:MAG: prepilin-type N-terminal cleavage/methylation domain-containing protein [Candidatus Omnitrophota bacterium]
MKEAFTIIELVVVVVVIAVLISIAFPIYTTTKERAFDKEATANLKLIQAAQKIYKMEAGGYYSSNLIDDINTYLRLDIPKSATKNWGYNVTNETAGASGTATRIGNSRSWSFSYNSTGDPGCASGSGGGTKCP